MITAAILKDNTMMHEINMLMLHGSARAVRRVLMQRDAPFIRVAAPSHTSYDTAVREISIAPPSSTQPGNRIRRAAIKRKGDRHWWQCG